MHCVKIYKEWYGHYRKRNHSLRAVVNIIFLCMFLPTSLFNVSVIMELILLQKLLSFKDLLWRPATFVCSTPTTNNDYTWWKRKLHLYRSQTDGSSFETWLPMWLTYLEQWTNLYVHQNLGLKWSYEVFVWIQKILGTVHTQWKNIW